MCVTMRSKCTILELLILYIFSAYYLLKELIENVLGYRKGLTGRVFMKCDGRTALITGGSTGIGLETTKKLLSFGMNVIIGSDMSPEKSERCVEMLRTEFPRCKVEIWYVDLSSMDSVKAFAERFLMSGMPLHILINNAGIMFAPYKRTEDGFESHLAVNYLSGCVLTKLLLPRLRQSSATNCCSRIVNVSSCLHYLAPHDLPPFQEQQESYCPHESYMSSKLYQVMFTMYLNRFLSSGKFPVRAIALHPGVCYTPLYKHVWWAPYVGPLILQNPIKGAEITLYAALSADLEEIGGKYIENFQFVKPSQFSQNAELQTRLWNETWKVLKPWIDDEDETEETKIE